jgi:hypothetical protein
MSGSVPLPTGDVDLAVVPTRLRVGTLRGFLSLRSRLLTSAVALVIGFIARTRVPVSRLTKGHNSGTRRGEHRVEM